MYEYHARVSLLVSPFLRRQEVQDQLFDPSLLTSLSVCRPSDN